MDCPAAGRHCLDCRFCEFELTTFDPQIACEKHQWVGFRDSSKARKNCPTFEARA